MKDTMVVVFSETAGADLEWLIRLSKRRHNDMKTLMKARLVPV